ncbi:Uncharacterized protein APZ42_004380, partial [Daphnia magna]
FDNERVYNDVRAVTRIDSETNDHLKLETQTQKRTNKLIDDHEQLTLLCH